jgi:hypothetical protein
MDGSLRKRRIRDIGESKYTELMVYADADLTPHAELRRS